GLKPRFFGLELCLQFVDCFVDIGKTWLFPSDCISLFSLRHENQISEFPAHFEALCVGFFFVCLFVLLSFFFLNIFIYLFIFFIVSPYFRFDLNIKFLNFLLTFKFFFLVFFLFVCLCY